MKLLDKKEHFGQLRTKSNVNLHILQVMKEVKKGHCGKPGLVVTKHGHTFVYTVYHSMMQIAPSSPARILEIHSKSGYFISQGRSNFSLERFWTLLEDQRKSVFGKLYSVLSIESPIK